MALDGAFLRHIKKEVAEAAIGAKVDKVYQPNREEMVLALRARSANFKLLLSARANSARIHFTRFVPENPKSPPMLCMLLRKRLLGARLAAVEQPELERVLRLEFDAVNELGDEVRLTLVMEIMGRYSNIIFVDENNKIIDALKRVDAEMSSERLVLPGLTYLPPPPQHKLCLLSAGTDEILDHLESLPADAALSRALLSVLQGVSPVVCRELQQLSGRGADLTVHGMNGDQKDRLRFFLERLTRTVRNTDGTPYLIADLAKKPMDFSFFNITQYGSAAVVSQPDHFSELLDAFYEGRDRMERMRVRSQDLLRILSNASDRLSRKINLQRAELENCAHRDELRMTGDLLSANLYQMEKGQTFVELQNFYEEGAPVLRIRLDPALTPSQNAQKYYRDYRKARTAEEKLTEQITRAQTELEYLDSVFEELSRAVIERDLAEIRQELVDQGYIRAQRGKRKPVVSAAPLEFISSDGFRILAGRNNRQNDQLTLRQANNNDIWFHTKNIPGSHVILVTSGQEPSETALREAAILAAAHSRGRDSSQVPVDYTQIRHVNKPSGAKPGKVIYVNYNTIFVTPDMELCKRLSAENRA